MIDNRPYMALRACTAEPVPRCDGCPYLQDADCIHHVMQDAVELLAMCLHPDEPDGITVAHDVTPGAEKDHARKENDGWENASTVYTE